MSGIVIVDVGTGNLRSVLQAVRHAEPGCAVQISDSPTAVEAADRLILPGQGAIGSWMQRLQDEALSGAIRRALQCKPVLGICVGMQAMFQYSTENDGTEGLGIFTGRVERFGTKMPGGGRRKVPHMGWNRVQQSPHPMWRGIENDAWFYFVHSYYAAISGATVGRTEYGIEFTSAVAGGNIFAVQFHPEKSQACGLQMYRNFLAWAPDDVIDGAAAMVYDNVADTCN